MDFQNGTMTPREELGRVSGSWEPNKSGQKGCARNLSRDTAVDSLLIISVYKSVRLFIKNIPQLQHVGYRSSLLQYHCWQTSFSYHRSSRGMLVKYYNLINHYKSPTYLLIVLQQLPNDPNDPNHTNRKNGSRSTPSDEAVQTSHPKKARTRSSCSVPHQPLCTITPVEFARAIDSALEELMLCNLDAVLSLPAELLEDIDENEMREFEKQLQDDPVQDLFSAQLFDGPGTVSMLLLFPQIFVIIVYPIWMMPQFKILAQSIINFWYVNNYLVSQLCFCILPEFLWFFDFNSEFYIKFKNKAIDLYYELYNYLSNETHLSFSKCNIYVHK